MRYCTRTLSGIRRERLRQAVNLCARPDKSVEASPVGVVRPIFPVLARGRHQRFNLLPGQFGKYRKAVLVQLVMQSLRTAALAGQATMNSNRTTRGRTDILRREFLRPGGHIRAMENRLPGPPLRLPPERRSGAQGRRIPEPVRTPVRGQARKTIYGNRVGNLNSAAPPGLPAKRPCGPAGRRWRRDSVPASRRSAVRLQGRCQASAGGRGGR